MSLTGTVLAGRYELAEKLGAGGMAVVYRAQDTLLQRPVTVKILRGELAVDDSVVKRFRREAQAAAALSHPNIVGVYDVGRQDDVHYIVMEYVQGKTLKEEIAERGPLPPEEAVRFARQICEALRHAHAHRIIHRDVKPHNVLLTPEGRVKVGDFGIAGAATGSTVTYPGALLGTVYYFSPEQAQGGYGDQRSDLYALGVVLYEMLTGQVPFEGESPVSVALKHIREAVPSPREINPRVPPSAERVVLKAMAKDVDRRYQSASEMLRDLEALQRQLAEWRSARGLPPVSPDARDRTQVIALSPAGGEDEGGQSTLPGVRPGEGLGAAPVRARGRRGSGDEEVPGVAAAGREAGGGAPPGPEKRDEGLSSHEVDPGDFGGDLYDLDGSAGHRRGPRRHLSKTTVWIASFAIFFALVGTGLFLVVQWFEVPEVSVPNVVGSGLLEAQTKLAQYRLGARVVSYDFNAQVPNGQVIDQDPDAGAVVKANRTINLWVSKGPEVIGEIPDVIGFTWREAKIALETVGLIVSESDFTYAHSETMGRDRVLSQSPAAGTSNVPKGTRAQLVVSLGPQAGTVVVPNFIGQTLDQARLLLPEFSLTEGAVSVRASTEPDGTVLEQSPIPGTEVAAGTAVSFTVAGSGGSDTGGDDTQQHVTRVEFTVPTGQASQMVRITVTDSQGERTVYEHEHTAGYEGKIDVTWTGSLLRVQIYYDGVLSADYTVSG
ncbi:MAG: Stk1 family PASTA domain-containing Ser/Thr kinase [Bacillota bacterium]|nr:MAG: Stk1 family PASTA domain-containing Ser/Thr kinase [Bacillota bacterium]